MLLDRLLKPFNHSLQKRLALHNARPPVAKQTQTAIQLPLYKAPPHPHTTYFHTKRFELPLFRRLYLLKALATSFAPQSISTSPLYTS
jgi:hypothetical protein